MSITSVSIAAPAQLGNFPEWTPFDGPAPHVWANRPAGHRCAWTCVWVSYHPGKGGSSITTPADWGFEDPGKMLPEQVQAELEDMTFGLLLAAQHFQGTGMEKLLAASLSFNIHLPNGVNDFIRQQLENFRATFSHSRAYVNPYSPPEKLLRPGVQRPGWHKE